MRTAYALRWWLAAWMMFQALPLWAQVPTAEQRAALQQRLDAKLAELEAVQHEVEQLQRELNLQPQLLVHVKIYDVSRTKMRNLGIDWAQASNGTKQNPEELFKQPGFMQALVEKNIARLHADPTVVTLVGRPATFHVGGETPIGQLKYGNFGTQIDLLGTLAGKDQIELDLKVRRAELDHANQIDIDGKKHPGLRVKEVDTGVQLKSGDSFVLQGPLEDRIETVVYTGGRKESRVNQIQSVIVVTAELMDAPLGGFSTVTAAQHVEEIPADAFSIKFKRLEIDLTRLAQSHPELQAIDPVTGDPSNALIEKLKLPIFVDLLKEGQIALMTGEPRLSSLPGKSTWFSESYGEVPIVVANADGTFSIDSQRLGTTVEMVGAMAGEDRLRLDLHMTYRELDESRTETIGGNKNPVFRTSGMKATVEVKNAETAVLWERFQGEANSEKTIVRRADQQGHDIRAVWLLKPEFLERPVAAAAPSPYPSTDAPHAQPQRLNTNVKLVQINLTAAAALGEEFEALRALCRLGEPYDSDEAAVLKSITREEADRANALVKKMVEQGIARIESDNTFQTVTGHPGEIDEGETITAGRNLDGTPHKHRLGTYIKYAAESVGFFEVSVNGYVRYEEIDEAMNVTNDDITVPGIRVEEIGFTGRLKSGNTGLLRGRIDCVEHFNGKQVARDGRVAVCQSLLMVTPTLAMTVDLAGRTVRPAGPQPQQPAETGYALGKMQSTLVAPQPTSLQYAIEVQVQMMELSLTKLRSLGHEVDGSNDWIKAFGLEDLHAAHPFVDGQSDVVLIPPSEEYGLAIEQHVGPLMKSGVIKIVGRPTAITRSGEDVLMELASDSLNYRLALTPTLLDAKQHSMELDLKFSLSEASPGSSAQKLADSKAFVVSTTERKLRGLYAAAIFPGPKFRRNHLEVNGDHKQELVEEIVPVYVVLAGRKLVPATPSGPHETAAKPAIRR